MAVVPYPAANQGPTVREGVSCTLAQLEPPALLREGRSALLSGGQRGAVVLHVHVRAFPPLPLVLARRTEGHRGRAHFTSAPF